MLAWLKGAKSTKERYELSPVIASADRSVSETLKQSGSASRKRKRDRATIVTQLSNGLKSSTMPARMETQHLPDISASYGRKSRSPNDVITGALFFRECSIKLPISKQSLLKLVRLFCDGWRCQRRLLRYRDANIKIRYDAKLRNSLYMGHAWISCSTVYIYIYYIYIFIYI